MIRNRVLYGLIIFLSFIFIYFYGGKVPYMLFYTALALPVFSFLFTAVIYLRFKFTQELDTPVAVKGDKVNFIFSINNEDIFLYPYIKVNLFGADTIFLKEFGTKNFSLLPRNGKRYTYELECKYRGKYAIGIKSIEIEDFLGIFRLVYKAETPVYITVYPKIIYLERFNLKTNYISEAHSILNNKYEDMSTISDIRKYKYGDSLKKIHWKLSAKMNEIMTRNYQSTSQTNVTIFLDLKKNMLLPEQNIIIEDKLIEAVVAVIHYCLANWIQVNIIYYHDGIQSISANNPMEFDSIYNILAVIDFNSEIQIKDIIDIYINDSMVKTNLIVITGNIDEELNEEIYKTKLLGYETGLMYVSPQKITNDNQGNTNDILMYLTELGVNTYKIELDDNIKEILEC